MQPLKSFAKIVGSFLLILFFSPIYWVSGFFKRDDSRIVFGCHLDKPAGNILYFFKHCISCNDVGKEFIWVAANKQSYQYMLAEGLPVVNKWSLGGVLICLRAGYYCYSSYVSDISFFFCRGAKGINVWHGTPLKKVEADINTGIYRLRYKYKFLFRLIQPWVFYPPHKIFVSSDYEISCFKTAFSVGPEQFYKTYPPRLADFVGPQEGNEVRNILIAPTFRDGSTLEYDNLLDFSLLNELGNKYDVVFHVKAHPSDVSLNSLDVSCYSHIEKVDRLTDIYQILTTVDSVITDYSSIFFDCHYLGMPFFLHWPDIEFYNANCREFYFDAMEDFSAVLSTDMSCLLRNLHKFIGGHEGYGKRLDKKFACYPVNSGYPLNVFEA